MQHQRHSYLKIIAECSYARPRVSNKQIRHFANVSPATVTETTRLLQRDKLVDRRRYTGVTLTDRGRRLACQLLHNYRLCEVFLTQQLKLPLSQVPAQAWAMADTFTPDTATALNSYLGLPERSPFGGVLEPCRVLDDTHVTRLSDVVTGQQVICQSYLETADLVDYLQEVALPLDVPVQITKCDRNLNLLYLELPQHREITLNLNAADYIYTKKSQHL